MSYSGPRRKPPARSTYSPFSDDCGAGGGFLLSVFLRDGEDVYRTYYTTARGLDQNAFVTGILDLTMNGRQEDWEDSPPGWPQNATYIIPATMPLHSEAMGFGDSGRPIAWKAGETNGESNQSRRGVWTRFRSYGLGVADAEEVATRLDMRLFSCMTQRHKCSRTAASRQDLRLSGGRHAEVDCWNEDFC
jgi:hypothetical protein